MRQRILLMYITVRSGHYQAARAMEEGIRRIHPRAQILTIDAFQYLNPVLARIVDRMYLSVIQKLPELWDYLYDNPGVVQHSEHLRKLLHRYDSPRLQGLLEEFQPEVIACSQAFPCGLVGDYKKEHGLAAPLYAVLTDFTPHAFWVHESVDGYIVPAEETRRWLLERKVPSSRIHTLGIPIDPRFAESPGQEMTRRRLQIAPQTPTILMMGGGQGLGPILEGVDGLDALPDRFQLLVVAGSNESLYHRLIGRIPRLKHPVQVFGHVDFVPDLMSVADLLITKTGGLTTSEALAMGLPVVALDPIPGQEIKNAHFLVREKVARLAEDPAELPAVVADLLRHPDRLQEMAANARRLGRPNAAVEAAELILKGP